MSEEPAAPLRVLFVNENIGGHATMHLHLRRGLAGDQRVDAQFIDIPARGTLRRLAGAPVPGLAGRDLDFQPLRAQLALSFDVRRRLRRRSGFDVLHVYTQNAGLLSVGAIRRHASVVATDASGAQSLQLLPYRAPTRWSPAVGRVSGLAERRVYRAATLVVAKSSWSARSLLDTGAVSEERLRLIPFGIVVPGLAQEQHRDDLPHITFVGRSMSRKGGWRLLELHQRFLRDRCVLDLVTPEHVDPRPGVRVMNDIRLGDGRLELLLAASAMLVFPTEADTFGYVALEAMAVGTPVVAYRFAALPEIVDDGVTGLLVEPRDDRALAEAILMLLDDEALRSRMGTAARARVLDKFDTRVTTAQLVDVLEEARQLHG